MTRRWTAGTLQSDGRSSDPGLDPSEISDLASRPNALKRWARKAIKSCGGESRLSPSRNITLDELQQSWSEAGHSYVNPQMPLFDEVDEAVPGQMSEEEIINVLKGLKRDGTL